MSMAVRSTIKRHPERGSHETDVVHAVLDATPMGHLGFVVDGQPFGPIDEPEDLDLPVWAGVVPCALAWGSPEPA
ncbi:MAG: hypothetical protein ABWZ14_00875 [Acidimicrobiales bacterium]